jgi:hypothetical protein
LERAVEEPRYKLNSLLSSLRTGVVSLLESGYGREGKGRKGEGTYDNKSAFLGVVFDYYVYS